MKALHQKLWRDLWGLKGQIITISLVIASGIASYASLQSCYRSLVISKANFYAQSRFADVFVNLERAPRSVARTLERIPGVQQVYDHILHGVMVPIATLPEPAVAHVVSIPDHGPPRLNAVMLRRGRWPDPRRSDEVVLLEVFATSHGLEVGSTVPAVLNGRLQNFRVVGHGVSPEYVFPAQGGLVSPDAARFAVFWMPRSAAEAAFDQKGAFNAAAFSVDSNASLERIKDEVDHVLQPYGGRGAYDADDQPSNARLEGEFLQLRAYVTVVPAMFLGVAALLLNIVLSRLVLLQRTQIATLKALGYDDLRIGIHYVLMFSTTLLLGSTVGLAGGAWLGRAMTDLYLQFFRFPSATFVLEPAVALTGVGISAAAGLLGAAVGMASVVRLPPAEAMRPPAPARYRPTILERLGLARFLSPATAMVLREVERRPLRTLLSSVAIAAATAIMITGLYSKDAIDHILSVTLQTGWREDIHVEFDHPVDVDDLRAMRHVPGVIALEPLRTVPVRFHFGHREKDGLVFAYTHSPQLRRPFTTGGIEMGLPQGDALLTDRLAKVLGVQVGDTVRVKSQEETRPEVELRVGGLIDEPFGLIAHVHLDALAAKLGELPRSNSVLLTIDGDGLDGIRAHIKQMPSAMNVLRLQGVIDEFRNQTAKMLWVTMLILTAFSCCIVVGVVYNNARVALSMRSRDLATMRVLGFHRSEISGLLMGELAIQVALAIPIGLTLGVWLCHGIAATVDPDQFRLPVILSRQTLAFSTLVTVGAGLFAALLVRRRLDRLDLIGVLKTRE